jgi:HD-like signal output (HDOD) protein
MATVKDTVGSRRTMDDLVDAVGQLHSSPTVAYQVLQILEDPDFEIHDLEKHLEADPALAAAVMRLANSSFSGFSQRISSLRQAMTLLGARSLRLVVLTAGLVDRLTNGAPADVCRDYWRRSLSMAVSASRLFGRENMITPDEAYMAGLLADIGVLVFAQADTDYYIELYESCTHGPELMEAERARYGFDHPSLGAHLLCKWALPELLTHAIAQHHDDCGAEDGFQRAAFAGDLLADVLWTPQTSRMLDAQEFFQEYFSFDLDQFISFVLACKEDIAENADVFCADLQETVDCRLIVMHARRKFETEALDTALECDSMTAFIDQDLS